MAVFDYSRDVKDATDRNGQPVWAIAIGRYDAKEFLSLLQAAEQTPLVADLSKRFALAVRGAGLQTILD